MNYSHARTCKGNPENQVKPEPVQEQIPPEPVQEVCQPEPVQKVYQPVQHSIKPLTTYQQIQMEQRRAHLEKIKRLSRFIV